MSDRLRQEIDEILSKYEKFPLREPLPRRLRRKTAELTTAAGRLLGPLRYVTAGRLMLLGVILILAAYFSWGGGSITQSVVIAGLIFFRVSPSWSPCAAAPRTSSSVGEGAPWTCMSPASALASAPGGGAGAAGAARRDSTGRWPDTDCHSHAPPPRLPPRLCPPPRRRLRRFRRTRPKYPCAHRRHFAHAHHRHFAHAHRRHFAHPCHCDRRLGLASQRRRSVPPHGRPGP